MRSFVGIIGFAMLLIGCASKNEMVECKSNDVDNGLIISVLSSLKKSEDNISIFFGSNERFGRLTVNSNFARIHMPKTASSAQCDLMINKVNGVATNKCFVPNSEGLLVFANEGNFELACKNTERKIKC